MLRSNFSSSYELPMKYQLQFLFANFITGIIRIVSIAWRRIGLQLAMSMLQLQSHVQVPEVAEGSEAIHFRL